MADNNEKTIKEVFEELDVLVERLEDRVEKKMLQINEDGTFCEFSR